MSCFYEKRCTSVYTFAAKFLVILGFLSAIAAVADAQTYQCPAGTSPIRSLAGIQSITIYEMSRPDAGPTNIINTYPINDSRLSADIAQGVLAADLSLLASTEFYDFFYSNEDGTLNPNGQYLSIECTRINFLNNSATGNNIDSVSLNFADGHKEYASIIASTQVGSGLSGSFAATNGYAASSLGSPDNQVTYMGDGNSRLTLGFCSQNPAPQCLNGSTPQTSQQNFPIPVTTCTGGTQTCNAQPTFTFQMSGSGTASALYTVGSQHCSYTRLHYLVDGIERGVTEYTGWPGGPGPLTSQPVSLGGLSSGSHTIKLVAEGLTSGCNLGAIGSWSGTVGITTSICPSGPQCSDGVDNDGDGKIDLADPGCTGPTDTDETDTCILLHASTYSTGPDLSAARLPSSLPANVQVRKANLYQRQLTAADLENVNLVVYGDWQVSYRALNSTEIDLFKQAYNRGTNFTFFADNPIIYEASFGTRQIMNNIQTRMKYSDKTTGRASSGIEAPDTIRFPYLTGKIFNFTGGLNSPGFIENIQAPAECAHIKDGFCIAAFKPREGNQGFVFAEGNWGAGPSGVTPGQGSANYITNFINMACTPPKPPQCSDAIDNDSDGAIDYPADFSCSSATDNDETNPKAQCQDLADNDGDALIDFPVDPGCSSTQDNNEGDGTTQCQDGGDNDGDGATDFPADFSCSSPTDNDETFPKAQCQDAFDNDSDSLIDFPADPGCSSRQDNNESDGTTQCQDGVDNDNDAAVDFPTDFSCSSPTDNDEANPKAQCQDGVDNDGDTLVDFSNDPGCSSRQDNNESDGTTQCQDGIDNDNDGATDYPNDFSCSSPTDNDETNPKAQCQDGTDNDSDGLIDFPADPGCSSKQDNNESDGTSQCQDNQDNDNDGARDFPSDFSCSSPTDNDETNPKAQCQDGADNDSDGLIDFPADPGCSSKQDNNESDGSSHCQDGVDNDNDGSTDYPADFSCSSPTDNDETNPKAQCQDSLDNDSDGLADFPTDPGCSSRQDNNESDGTTQCQDGADNDGDGATDHPADFSCSSPTDNDESNPKAQCQDGIDNDGDSLSDFPADPGCSSKQDNNEGDGTTQCQDGLDNDSDGAIDYPADYSCSSPTDPDETNPRAQCQDTIDNDSDSLIDFPADPGCASPQDNTESNGTSQCQDGVDNDNDGATDYPADFSCSSPTDNDETNPKSQCQDTADNDSDGATDFPADFSCSSPQDHDEALPKTQCQDNIDNDSDSLIDFPADTGCFSRQDNSESDGTSQCQDGADNDSDGATDYPADFGCNSPSDNDESNPKAQCQDGIDNDGDGLIDLNDPDCQNPNDNDEQSGSALVIPLLECVTNNGNGTYTAYFGYQNLSASSVTIVTGSTVGKNNFSPGALNQGQVQTFSPGRVKAAFRVTFSGQPLTWTVQTSGAVQTTVSASSSSQACGAVVPRLECIDIAASGSYDATFSYQNPNDFDIVIPFGTFNQFSPAPTDRGQPELFSSGNVNSAFKARFSSSELITWTLAGRIAQANSSSVFCPSSQGCSVSPTVTTRSELDATALELANTTVRASNDLVKVSNKQPRVVIDAERSKRKAKQFLKEANELTFKFPEVMTTCPNLPNFCAQIDNKPTIDGLASLYRRQFSAIRRIAARGVFRTTNAAKTRGTQYVNRARKSYNRALAALKTIPRFATECA